MRPSNRRSQARRLVSRLPISACRNRRRARASGRRAIRGRILRRTWFRASRPQDGRRATGTTASPTSACREYRDRGAHSSSACFPGRRVEVQQSSAPLRRGRGPSTPQYGSGVHADRALTADDSRGQRRGLCTPETRAGRGGSSVPSATMSQGFMVDRLLAHHEHAQAPCGTCRSRCATQQRGSLDRIVNCRWTSGSRRIGTDRRTTVALRYNPSPALVLSTRNDERRSCSPSSSASSGRMIREPPAPQDVLPLGLRRSRHTGRCRGTPELRASGRRLPVLRD